MKKIISILLVLTIIFSCLALVGCNRGTGLDKSLEAEILEDFLITTAMLGDIAPEEIDYTFFGQYGDSIAIYFHTAGAYDIKTEENVAGIKFKYPDSRTIKIWNNGKFYKMPEAHELGLITKEDIFSIKFKSLFLNHEEPHFKYNSKRITEVPLIFYEKPEIFYWNMLEVILDENISRVNSVPSVEFFGSDIVKEVINASGSYNKTDKNFDQHVALILYSNTPEALYEARKRIEQIDGVKSVLFCDDMLAGSANDNYYNYQWGLNSIEVEKVWDFTTGTKDVFVGVIDYGINLHTDLLENLSTGYDFVNDNSNTSDASGDIGNHGTHVAGIIGAVGNNAKGVTGVNWNVTIVPLQVYNNWLPCSDYIEEAIEYATDTTSTNRPIRLLNLSMSSSNESYNVGEAIRNFSGLVICAAGNENSDNDRYHSYPGYYGSSLITNTNPIYNIIVVGAIDADDNRAIFDSVRSSNYGEKSVDIYAPGINIYSTNNTSDYSSDYGTSFATPFVTGVAALLLSVNPDLTAAQLKECILNGSDQITITTGDGETQQVRKLNAWKAFQYLLMYYPTFSRSIGYINTTYNYNIDADADYMIDNTSMMKFNVQNPGTYTFNISADEPIVVEFYSNNPASDEDDNYSNLTEISVAQTSNSDNSEIQFTITLTEGTYYLRTNYAHSTSEGTVAVAITCPPHNHQYDEWTYYSTTQHVKRCTLCDCEGELGTHATKSSLIVGNKATCIICGYAFNIDLGFGQIIHTITKYSVNGSYILPSGVIVLVDEDVEAYFNGTLVFYEKDKLPVTQ